MLGMSRDRFRTYWTGPYHRVALRWATEHGISFEGSGNEDIQLGRGAFFSIGGIPSADDPPPADLRIENDKYDDEVRARHATDTDLNTGTSDVTETNWSDKTRGEKLRECRFYVETYDRILCIAEARKQALRENIDTNPEAENAYENRCLPIIEEYAAMLRRLTGLMKDLESLVQQEVEDGWDWERGIEEQKAVRSEVHEANKTRSEIFHREKKYLTGVDPAEEQEQ